MAAAEPVSPVRGASAHGTSERSTFTSVQNLYYHRIHQLVTDKMNKHGNEIIEIHPTALPGATVENNWKDLRTAVVHAVFNKAIAGSFNLSTDGQTHLLQTAAQDKYSNQHPPIAQQWFSPSSPGTFTQTSAEPSTSAINLSPGEVHYVVCLDAAIKKHAKGQVLVINLENFPIASLQPVRNLRAAIEFMLSNGDIAAFACDLKSSRFHIMPKDGDTADLKSDITRSTLWISLLERNERQRPDMPAQAPIYGKWGLTGYYWNSWFWKNPSIWSSLRQAHPKQD